MLRNLFLLVMVLALAGCSDKIRTVKDAPSLEENFTIGQALDNDPTCGESEWTTFKDDTGREIVEFTCHVKLDPGAVAASKKEQLESLQMLETAYANRYISTRQELEKVVVTGLNDGESQRALADVQQLESRLASLRAGTSGFSEAVLRGRIYETETALVSTKQHLDRLQASAKARSAEFEPVYQRVIEIEEAHGMVLRRMHDEDEKLVESTYAKGFKLSHKIQFLVVDERVKRIALGFYVEGKELEFNPTTFAYNAQILEAPKYRSQKAGFWVKQIPRVPFSLHKFPYDCGGRSGCTEKKS